MEYRPHPVRGAIAQRGMTVRAVACAIGKSVGHTGRCFLGERPTTPAFRRAVAEVLGLPEQELFYPEPELRRGRFRGNDELPGVGGMGVRPEDQR